MIKISDIKLTVDAAYVSYDLLTQLVSIAAVAAVDAAEASGEDFLWDVVWDMGRASSPFYPAYLAAQASYYAIERLYVSHPDYVGTKEDWQNV